MRNNLLFAAAAIAALILVPACEREPEVVTINEFDPMAEALKNAGPVELPPGIQESRTYRCADNSLYYVDFYTNGTALLRTERGGTPTQLTALDGNPPYVGEGYSVSANADDVSINGKSCHT